MILFPRMSSYNEGTDRMRTLGVGLRTLGLEIEVLPVAADSPLAGATIDHIEHEAVGSLFVIAVNRRDGETITRPDPSIVIEAGDGVVVVTRSGRATPRIT
jgi:voltage-gated potassium channel